jgi:hypothetical protein
MTGSDLPAVALAGSAHLPDFSADRRLLRDQIAYWAEGSRRPAVSPPSTTSSVPVT